MEGDSFVCASPDGAVEATVDGFGRLVGLRLSPEIRHRPADAVARAVVATVAEAQETAWAQVARRIADGGTAVDPHRLAAALEEADLEAEQRLARFAAIVSDVTR